MRKAIFMCLFQGILISSAQVSPSKLPEKLPPTPEVAAIVKGAELSSHMHTGTAKASIPLYTIDLKEYSLPISLDYSSNGVVLQEICSREGIGWNLNAGGVINRVIQGKPDEYSTFLTPVSSSEIATYTDAAYNYCNQIADDQLLYDARPDLYKFSINGVYGSFMFLRDGTILQFPYSNNRITAVRNPGTYSITSFTITDEKGIVYQFDTYIERTYQHNLQSDFLNKQALQTTWFLRKITLPNTKFIEFTYTPLQIQTVTGTTQILTKGIYSSQGGFCSDVHDNQYFLDCPVDQGFSEKTSFIKYNTFLLNNIYTSDGTAVFFSYENKPDNTGDKRLTGVSVVNNQVPTQQLKNIGLSYIDPYGAIPALSQANARYYLKTVSSKNLITGVSSLDFNLNYVGEENFPVDVPPLGIDYLGYSNGKRNFNLIPYLEGFADLYHSFNAADRNPDGNFAKIGMLNKITYPTGGWSTFEYEPNMLEYWGNIPNHNLTLAYIEGDGPPSGPSTTYSVDFTAVNTEDRKLHFYSEFHGTASDPQDASTNKTVFCRFKDLTTGSIHGYYILGYTSGTHIEELIAGHTYRIELEVRNYHTTFGKAYIDYDIGVGTHWGEIKEELCGVRVKSNNNFDPVSQKTNSRFYKYKLLYDSTVPSAVKQYDVHFISDATTEQFIPCTYGYFQCQSKVISSNPYVANYNSAGAVTYKSVIESDDENFANGGIAHLYNTVSGILSGPALVGKPIPDGLLNPDDFLNGTEQQTLIFDKDRNIVKEITNTYVTDPRYYKSQDGNYLSRKRFELSTGPVSPIDEEDFRNLDIQEYYITRSLYHLDNTVTKEYAPGGTVSTDIVTYGYATLDNINPTSITHTNSKGQTRTQVLTYPNQLGDPLSLALVQKNILGTPTISEEYLNGTLLHRSTVVYKDWFNDGNIISPVQLKEQKGSNPEYTAVVFDGYDVQGNITTMSKKDDAKTSLLWNYLKTYPVAQVKNAAATDGFAYTSFEADDKGKWNFAGTSVQDAAAVTGTQTYPLTGGGVTLNTSFVAHKKYVLTVWASSGSFTIGSQNPVLVAGGRNGWNLYKMEYPDISPEQIVSLSGTASIDELRFYPAAASMNTLAYQPGLGVTHTCDENNRVTSYEYDGFNRLLRIRDKDGNVVKQYDYAYLQPMLTCTGGTGADWVATGATRCQRNELNGTYTGNLEREEKDNNLCSNTYGQLRWTLAGTSSTCSGIICRGPGKRLVGTTCETTDRIYTASVYLGDLWWQCTYHYTWSDGYSTPPATEITNHPCPGQLASE